jgi:deoxyribodipyrimidine photo-lyase
MTRPPAIVWFRQDLRLADNPALMAAAERGGPVVPVYILDDDAAGDWRPGGASRWWLHHSLVALARDLEGTGAPLVLRRGPSAETIGALIEATGADAVHWNRCYEPYAVARDKAIKRAFKNRGIAVESCNGASLLEPWHVGTQQGEPYKVFTPFWKQLRAAMPPARPLPAPKRLAGLGRAPDCDRLEDWGLLPRKPDWADGLREAWTPGEAGARDRLQAFLDDGLERYADRRDRPDRPDTSRLSPHLHFGELSPRQAWHGALAARVDSDLAERQVGAFLRELGWREFCLHLLHHWPALPDRAWRPAFQDFPWAADRSPLAAWQQGRTGYPIVDAGMHELWRTGWMHNRVRMVAASFLVKHLLIPWQEGEAWFWDTLVDADLASNAANWQWVAGSGADAAPYFRIFNPVLQGRKFDPDGAYVRRWVQELARLPAAHIHAPWDAPESVLRDAGVRLGETYPPPIVDHKAARERALAAFAEIKG